MARRPLNTFSLSFLDCMCCGFGAIILVFIVIIHRVAENTESMVENLRVDARRQEVRVDALSSVVKDALAALHGIIAELAGLDADVARLSTRLEIAGAEARAKTPPPEPDEQTPRPTVGKAHEVQLIGLTMDGRRSLILVDASASMLDRTIVGVVQRRHRSAEEKRRAPKWRRTLAAVDWITQHLRGEFQIYTFDVYARPVIDGTEGQWLNAGDQAQLDRARAALHKRVPGGGTSLHAAVRAVAAMKPRPDSVYLLIDSLPTQGSQPLYGGTVTGRQRLTFFRQAVRELPRGVTVNVILYPLEGDPGAASAYWDLALATSGSLVSPSEDWP